MKVLIRSNFSRCDSVWALFRTDISSRSHFGSSAAMSRGRYDGTPKELANLLMPVVWDRGRSFLKYDENPVCQKARVEVQNIRDAKEILGVLHNATENLSFKKWTLRAALYHIMDECKELHNWGIAEKDKGDYVETMACRLMNVCRVVSQTMTKHTKTTWLLEMPWSRSSDIDGEGKEDNGEEGEASKEYVFGWNSELRLAWRCHASRKRVKSKAHDIKEMCNWIQVPENDDEVVIAHWTDEVQWCVPDVRAADYRAMRGPPPSRMEFVWEGTHVLSNHKLMVKRRPDRGLLMVIFEQSCQICQTAVSLFNDDEDQGSIHQVSNASEKVF